MDVDVVAEVSTVTGLELRPRGRLAGGEQNGAELVVDQRDRLLAIKQQTVAWKAERMLRAFPAITYATDHGWPAARWLWAGRLDDGSAAVVQEHLAGEPIAALDRGTVEAIVAANNRQAGLAHPEAFDDSEQLLAVLDGGCSWQSAVADRSPAGAELVHAGGGLRALLASSLVLPTADVVHGDYSSSNLISVSGGIGFVDCETVGRGTRVRDLADLYRQCFIHPGAPADAVELLGTSAVAIAGPEVFTACVVAVTYNNLAWWAEHRPRADFDEACRRAQVLFEVCRSVSDR